MSMYIGTAVSRQGRQGDLLGIGAFIGRGLQALGKIGKQLPLPGAGILGGTMQRVGTVLGPRRGAISTPTITPMFPSLPDVVQRLRPGMAQFTGGGTGGGGGGGMTKDGRPRRIRRDGRPYKRPSMNFANGRAIKRAARRLEGAEKMFRRVFSIRHGGSPGKVLPKKGRR